jgi:hypothetical protein
MQTLSQQAQQRIERHQSLLSPYMLPLGMAMAKTYLIPFTGVLIANVLINLLMTQVEGLFSGILGSTATLAIFLGILFYGWRWTEARWHGTSLFVEYTAISKARRTLQTELKEDKSKEAVIQKYLDDYTQLATAFIETMKSYGYSPKLTDTQS